jgi:hypothetical protein
MSDRPSLLVRDSMSDEVLQLSSIRIEHAERPVPRVGDFARKFNELLEDRWE